jgi:hypothetical protein
LPAPAAGIRDFAESEEKRRLRLQRLAADLVEKQRSKIGLLGESTLARSRSGVGATLVTERFVLREGFRNRAAIDRNERIPCAKTQSMNGFCDHVLAGCALALISTPTSTFETSGIRPTRSESPKFVRQIPAGRSPIQCSRSAVATGDDRPNCSQTRGKISSVPQGRVRKSFAR